MKTERRLTGEELKLINENIALARFLYQVYLKKLQKRADYGIDPDDLMSQAYYGLVRAAMRYRSYGEENGYSEDSITSGQFFGVFARKSIIGQMLDHLRKIDHVHTLVRNDYKLLVAKGFGSSEESLAEIAFKADLPLDRAQKVVQMIQSKPVYLDDTVGTDEDQHTVGSNIAHSGGVETSALESSLRQALVERFDALPPLQKFVIAGKYYGNRELPELADYTDISLTALRKAHTEALIFIHEGFMERLS